MKITIVTVCLNAEEGMTDTIQSVVAQTYPDVEYIIQDGGSCDQTVSIVQEYQQKYGWIHLYQEKDTGLYNAMNRAIVHATGDYILFLNSKDVLCHPTVLEEIAAELDADIVMGNVIRLRENGAVTEKYFGRNRVFWMLLSGKMPCHQVIFAKKDILTQLGGFQEKYTICADFDFMVRSCRRGYTMKYVDIDVSRVDCVTGISSQTANLETMRRQDDQSIRENYPLWYQLLRPVKYLKRKFT